MSGVPDAVKIAPSPVPSNRLAQRGPERRSRRQRPSAISSVAWVPSGDLAQSEWWTIGRRLGAIGRCSQWWIGDWIRYGTSRWGEKYAEAARITGYDVASLRNMAWVASRFDSSLRNDKLTWSHHVLLAPCEPAEQKYWLERAVSERLSVADLRVELRARREIGAGQAPAAAARGVPADAGVCPHCGHALDVSD